MPKTIGLNLTHVYYYLPDSMNVSRRSMMYPREGDIIYYPCNKLHIRGNWIDKKIMSTKLF